VRRDRMAENFAVFDFTLTDAELARIATMDTDTGLFVDHEDPRRSRDSRRCAGLAKPSA
jgi:2,5-diketo-D-gluconate reductase A